MQYAFFGKLVIVKIYRKYLLPFIVSRVRGKTRINVIFLAMNPDMWKYGGVYRKFTNNPLFNPIVVTAMRNVPNMMVRLEEQEKMVSYFRGEGIDVVRGYDVEAQRWIKLKSLNPDIIFYTQPYDGIIEQSFEYLHHLGALFCYAPYSFQLSNVNWNWDNALQQYCWKVFCVGDVQLRQCEHLSRIGRSNVVPVGYCFEEEYSIREKDKEATDRVWRNDARKRIVWAPHHSIDENEWFKVSSFLEIADLMVQFREEYKDKVIFAFKPHPVLKTKLYKIWGVDKTDLYYEGWARAENSFYAQGDYHSLFAGSDGMIHCSGSFIVEYLYTGKPVAYVYSKTRNPPDLGPIGDASLDAHYPIHNEADIRRFIDRVIIEGADTMSSIRNDVYCKYLRSPNGKPFSENVYLSILEGLGIECKNR